MSEKEREVERKRQSQSMHFQLMASRICNDISTGFEVSREKLNKRGVGLASGYRLSHKTIGLAYINIILCIRWSF